MRLGIRPRLLGWLALVILPTIAAAWLVVNVVDERLSQRIEADLTNTRRLEAARIIDALEDYERDAVSLASGAHVQTFVGALDAYHLGHLPEMEVIGGVDNFAVVDPEDELPLQELADALQNKARQTGSEVVDVRLIGRDGQIYGETEGFSWEPYDPLVITQAMSSAKPIFGNAFRVSPGDDRLALVAPISNTEGMVVGALVLETRLGPIVDLVAAHEGFGETSEAHIAQPNAESDAEFITMLRFNRDAAYNVVVPAERDLPINQSLESPQGRLVRSPDYRGIDSVLALETIDSTGWGLVVKIDASEAFAPVREVQRVVAGAAAISALVVVVGWMLLLHPLVRRLRNAARAAERVAGGEYRLPIGDQHSDEIGNMSRSIDRLAADIDEDIRIRSVAEGRLQHQASHDDLTGLTNRQHATAILKRLLQLRSGPKHSILYLDIDSFKDINDAYGHGVGDEVLVAVAKRLSRLSEPDITVARWGGDEFVIVLPDTDRDGAAAVADRASNLLADPIATTTGQHHLRCSVGSATSGDSRSFDEMLNEADSAMFADKQRRTGSRATPSSAIGTVERALGENRIEVWYQPVVADVPGNDPSLVGTEALVRLRTRDGALLPPSDFVPAVENKQVGLALDRRVMEIAMSDFARWHHLQQVNDEFHLAINMGSASMRDSGLASFIATLADQLSLNLSSIELEISENTALPDSSVLDELRAEGVRIAVDDVGLRYSNLDRLVEMRPDIAKLDRRWLNDSASMPNGEQEMVLSTLTELCTNLGLTVVAEGVESEDQLTLVRELGITRYQGYYFDPPQPVLDFESKWCRQQTRV